MTHRFMPCIAQARALSDPPDYFSGRRRAHEPMPDNVLGFVRRTAAELSPASGGDSFHERWVLLVVLKGSGQIRLDRLPHRLRPGRAVLVPPLRLHGFPAAGTDLCWVFITFEWPGHSSHSAEWEGVRRVTPRALRHLEDLLRGLRTPDEPGNVTAARLFHLLRCLYPPVPGTPQPHGTNSLLAAVQARAARDPSLRLGELARSIGMSESHLRARFRTEAGMSVGRYLRETRLRAAARRLREHGVMVKEAADSAGYPDAFTFSRAFRRSLGVPPSSVRGTSAG